MQCQPLHSSNFNQFNNIQIVKLFQEALDKEDCTAISNLIKTYTELKNFKDRDGNTFLHIAVLKTKPSAIKFLLEQGFDPDAINNENKTALILAMESYSSAGNDIYSSDPFYSIIINLLKNGATSPQQIEDQIKLLNIFITHAVSPGHVENLKGALKKLQCDVNQQDIFGLRPLIVAYTRKYSDKREEVIKILKDHGAHLENLTEFEEYTLSLVEKESSEIHSSSQTDPYKQQKIVEITGPSIPDLSDISEESWDIVSKLFWGPSASPPTLLQLKHLSGSTVDNTVDTFLQLCRNGNLQEIREFYNKHRNFSDKEGNTLLHHLATHRDTVRFIKELDIWPDDNDMNNENESSTFCLAKYNRELTEIKESEERQALAKDVLEASLHLLRSGASHHTDKTYEIADLLNIVLCAWDTPGFLDKFKELLQIRSICPHFFDSFGHSPLQQAHDIKDESIKSEVIALIEGYTRYSEVKSKIPHLIIKEFEQACCFKNYAKVESLLNQHPKLLKVRDNLGNSFLHIAVLLNDYRLVEILLKHGADPKAINIFSRSVLCAAISVYFSKKGKQRETPFKSIELLLKSLIPNRGEEENRTLKALVREIKTEADLTRLKKYIKKWRVKLDKIGQNDSPLKCVTKIKDESLRKKTSELLISLGAKPLTVLGYRLDPVEGKRSAHSPRAPSKVELKNVKSPAIVTSDKKSAPSRAPIKPASTIVKGQSGTPDFIDYFFDHYKNPFPGIEKIERASENERTLVVICQHEKAYQVAKTFFESKKTETKSWFQVESTSALQFKATLNPDLKLSKSQMDKCLRDFRRDYSLKVLTPKQPEPTASTGGDTSPASTENNNPSNTVTPTIRLSGPVDLPIQVRRPDSKAKTRNQVKTEAIQEKLGRKNALAAPYAKGVKTDSKPKPAPKKPPVETSQALLGLSKKINATPIPHPQPEQLMDNRRGGVPLQNKIQEKAPQASKKEEQVSLNEQQQQLNQKVIQRLAAAIRAFGNFRDFYNRVYKRQDYSLDKPETKTWVVNTFEEHLLQIFEGIIDTSENAPSPLFDTEKRLTKLLNNHFIPKAELEQLRYRLRHAFHTRNEGDILELVKILKTKKARKRLRQLTTTTKPAFSIAKCNLLTRPSKKLTDTRAVLNELNRQFAIFKGITESWKPLFEYSDKLDGDLRDAAKKIFSNMAELLAKLPEGHPLLKDSLINSIRRAGNRNAHELDRLNLEGGGGEIPAITSEFLYRFREDGQLLKRIQKLIDRAIRKLEDREKFA